MNDVRAAERMTDAEFQDIQRRLCERNPLGLPFGHPVIRDVLNLVAEVLFQRAELQERPAPPDAAGPDLGRLAAIAEKATPGPWYVANKAETDAVRLLFGEAIVPKDAVVIGAVPQSREEFGVTIAASQMSEENAAHFAAFDPPTAKALLALARRGRDAGRDAGRELAELRERAEKAEAFKRWTHDYLDRHGVPHHPPGTHGAAGCRIGDRMDWLMAGRDRLRCVCESAIQCFGDEEGESAAAVLADIRDALALVPAPEVKADA